MSICSTAFSTSTLGSATVFTNGYKLLTTILKKFKVRVSEWLLLNAKWAIFQLFHGKKKSIFDEV
jgi:hypothetical protein